MIKRITLLVLAFSMIFSVCVSAEKSTYDYELLYNLNIVGGNYESFEGKRTVSQEEFLGSLIGLVTGERVQGEDVAVYALSKNIISSIDSAEMKMAISYERALSLTLNVLGYAKVIEYSGQDVSAVMNLASQNKLTKGVFLKAGDKLDGSSMITLLVNALEAEVLNTVLTDETGVFEKGYKNPLEAYREVVKITGQVTHTADTSLYGENGMGKGRIGIDDKLYEVGYAYSEELLGQTVYAYIQDETVLHVEPKYKDLEKIEIIGRDILSVSDDFTRVRYETDVREKDIKLNPALTVIYNGKNYEGYTKADLMPSSGKISCIDIDRDRVYDIVYVYSYETMVVRNISSDYRTISNVYDLQNSRKILDLTDENLDVRVYKNGEPVKLSSISINNVLSVAHSMSSEPIITIHISDTKINGTLCDVDEYENFMVVDETEYKVNKIYFDAINAQGSKIDRYSLANLHDFYLDAFGEIAFVKRDRLEGFEYVLLFKQRMEDESVRVKLLNVNDEWENVYYANKLQLNQQKKEFAETIFDQLGGKNMIPQLVLIKRDAEGKIISIKQPTLNNSYDPNEFTKTSEFERLYWNGDSSFNCRHYLSYDTIILLKPNNSTDIYDEDKYEISNVGYFVDGRPYTYTAYNVDEFGYPDLFEVKDIYTPTINLYVNKVKIKMDEEGNLVKYIVGNISGVENLGLFEYPGAITTDVKRGDIVSVDLRNGRIIKLKLEYSAGASKVYECPNDDSSVHGGVNVMGDVVGIDPERRMLLVDCKTEVLPVYVQSKAEIEIYDEEERKYTFGSLNDIHERNYVRIKMSSNQVTSIGVFR